MIIESRGWDVNGVLVYSVKGEGVSIRSGGSIIMNDREKVLQFSREMDDVLFEARVFAFDG